MSKIKFKCHEGSVYLDKDKCMAYFDLVSNYAEDLNVVPDRFVIPFSVFDLVKLYEKCNNVFEQERTVNWDKCNGCCADFMGCSPYINGFGDSDFNSGNYNLDVVECCIEIQNLKLFKYAIRLGYKLKETTNYDCDLSWDIAKYIVENFPDCLWCNDISFVLVAILVIPNC